MSKARLTASLGASLVVLSSVFYATYGVWTRLMGEFFGGYSASAIRGIVVLLILTPTALAFRQLSKINWRHDWKYLVAMVAASTVVWGPLYYAILHAGIGITLTIAYAGIVIGMFFFGWLLAGEKFTKDKWLSVILGIVGLWLVFSPSLAGAGWVALVAALVSGVASSANSVFAKKLPYNASQSTLLLWVASVVANVPMAFLLNETMPVVGWHAEWLYMLFFGVASIIASWSFIQGIKLIEAGAAGVIGLLEIVFGVLFGVAFFSERPGATVLLGMTLVVAAALIPYIKDYNAQKGTLEQSK
jgi:drug/metabolite transporter (DMT)-like permease